MLLGQGSTLPQRFGPYTLLTQLCPETWTEAYLAEVTGEHRSVVVKYLPPSKCSEMEAVARLRHPNIATVEAVGEVEGRGYLAVEYLDGGDLHDRLARKPLSPRDAARLLATLARAVHHAHEQYVLHCDLHPSNVWFDRDGTPKVTDFGLVNQPRQLQDGAIAGEPGYLAPEQVMLQTSRITPWTDVYGLGALLYAALTGRPPFLADSPLATLELIRKAEPLPPSWLQPTVPPALDTICLCCLQKEPDERYATALALAQDLERLLQGQPILARPPGLSERGWRWGRRNALAAALAGALGAGILAALLILGFLWHRATVQRDEALATAQRMWETADHVEKQRAHAEASYRLAREALDRCLALQEDPRLQKGPLENLKRTLQDAQGTFLERFLQLPGEDADSRFERARSQVQLGRLIVQRGAKEATSQAVGHLENARAALAELARHHPQQSAYPLEEASALGLLGLLYSQAGQPARAGPAYEEAVALTDKLIAASPTAGEPHLLRAKLHINLAKLHEQAGKGPDAIGAYVKARADYEGLFQAQPQRLDFETGLVSVLAELGALYQKQRRPAEAAQCFEQAGRLLVEITRAHPQEAVFTLWLGQVSLTLAGLRSEAQDFEAALACYLRATAALEAVRPKLPRPNPTDEALKSAYRGRAVALSWLDRPALAVAAWDKALSLSTQPREREEICCERAAARVKSGDRARAAAEVEQLAGKSEPSPAASYALARVFALLARGEKPDAADSLGARAVQFLAHAQAIEQAYRDRDFTAIHARKDFQALLHPHG
jgi:tetratricopeptide (TPR) repeat protein